MGTLFLSVALALALPSQATAEQDPPDANAEESKPGDEEAKPGEAEPTPDAEESKPGEAEPAPDADESKPGEAEPAPDADESKPGEAEPAPGADESKPGEAEPAPAEEATPREAEPAPADEPTPVEGEAPDGAETAPTAGETTPEPAPTTPDTPTDADPDEAPTEPGISAREVDADEPPAPTEETIAELNARLVAAAASPSDAPFLHSVALEAELDGDYPRALELLRAAARLAPDDELITFDLARLALARGGSDEDLEPFWRTDAGGEDARTLRLAVARRLRRDVPGVGPTRAIPWLDARLSAGLAVDSNIAITPDDAPGQPVADDAPSHLVAARIAVSGALEAEVLRDPVAVDVNVMFDIGKYLDGSSEIANYDAAVFSLGSTLRYDIRSFLLTVSLTGTEIINDNFQSVFMQSIDTDVDLRVPWRKWHLGFYVGGGGRDYRTGNADEDPSSDRDCGILRAGVGWDWQSQLLGGTAGVRGRMGWAHEAAQGENFRVQSAVLLLLGRFNREPFETMVGLSNQLRVYPSYSYGLGDDGRVDNRITPFARVAYTVAEGIAVYGSYAYTNNSSTLDARIEVDPDSQRTDTARDLPDFDYNRHLAEVGVEVRL